MHTRVSDNVERLLRESAKRAVKPQNGVSFSLNDDFTLIDCHSREEFVWYIDWMNKLELAFRAGAGTDGLQLTLSMDGWKQIQPLPRPGGIPG